MQKQCPYQKPTPSKKYFFCQCPKVHSKGYLVNKKICDRCIYKDQNFAEWQLRQAPDFSEPSLFRKGLNFLVAYIEHAIDHYREAPEEIQSKREEICRSCDVYWDQEKEQCNHKGCGCGKNTLTDGMKTKWSWASSSCPIGEWKKFDV